VLSAGRGEADPCAPDAPCEGVVDPFAEPRADTTVAVPTTIPRLASGWALSVEVAGGASRSAFSLAPAFGQEVTFGTYVSSSTDTAWSAELVETCNLVLDRTTPQFGLIGIGGSHVARPEDPLIGPPHKTIDFHRVATGIALAYDGRQLVAGIGAEASVGYLVRGSHGLSAHLGGYFFDASDLSRNTLIMLSVGYVFSPVSDRPPAPHHPGRDETHACQYLSAYRYALEEVRRQTAIACQDEHAPACERIHDRTRVLNAAMNKCVLGTDVGPPEVPDAP
jgi:hypothetical protein